VIRGQRAPGPLIAIVIVLGGCSRFVTEYGSALQVDEPRLKVAKTTVGDVIDTLGPPSKLSALPNAVAFLYEQVATVENQLGVSTSSVEHLFLGAASTEALRLFKLSVAKGRLNRQALILVFDLDGLLRVKTFGTWTEKLGRGFGFGIIFQAVPLVETTYLWVEPDQHGWGASLLEPLPVALNARQNLATGQSGVQLRGTSTAAGQHTLEFRQ
jgi:hypothetical protein